MTLPPIFCHSPSSHEDLWDCINDDFDADPLAAVEAYFAEVEKVAALKPDILAHIDLLRARSACHILQGIFAIAHGGVAMDTGLLIICHR